MELATAAELDKLLAKADAVYNLPSGVKGDLGFLKTELKRMQVSLRKTAEVPANLLDDNTKALAAKVRDVFYHTEHVVGNFRARIQAHRMRAADLRGFNSKGLADCISSKLALRRARREFASGIRELKHDIQELRQYRAAFDFDSTSARRQLQIPVSDDLVGVDFQRDELVRLLTLTEEGTSSTSSRRLKVAAIVGEGPVGKTALAKVVYDSIAHQFDLAAWVTLSSRTDIIKILRGVLRQISQQEQHGYIEAMDPKQLIDKIRRTLQDKRYLIVLDDILDEPEWELLKSALLDNNRGSAVLTTSRKVGHHIHHFVGGFYELGPLSQTDSRKLFYKRVFGSEDNCPPELVGIAEEFIEKCGGMPLTIITMARLVAGKTLKTKDEWDAFYASISSGLVLDQIISQVFETSQHGLPPHLKPCLLYLSMFPEDCEVRGEQLVWQWIAEGFIRETGPQGRTLQELGEDYLNELIRKGLIEPVDVDAGGKVISCCVGSVVHDLIISMSTEENFVTVLDGQYRTLPNMIHRLSIQGKNVEQHSLAGTLSQVRSLVVFGDVDLMPSLSEFQGLRVLDIGKCYSLQNDFVQDIGNLFHLQCLILGGKGITHIPDKIGNLIFLETMDLRATAVIELPESIFMVKQLKRLYVNSRTRIPNGIAKLEALQELGDINISNTDLLKELCNLTRIKVIRIAIWSWDESYNDPVLEYLSSLVKRKQSIQSLSILTCCSLHFMDSLGMSWAPDSLQKLEIRHSTFLELPGWMSSLMNLTSLSIEVFKLSQYIIDTLGGMSNLGSLSLTSKHAPEGKFGIKTDGFRNLTGFHFASKAMGEMFAPGGMKMLKRLKVSFQVSQTKDVFKGFCFGLENLTSVEHVRVEMNCFSASPSAVKDAEAAIQEAVSRGRSNSLNLKIQRVQEREEYMVETEDELVVPNITEEQEKDINKIQKKRFNLDMLGDYYIAPAFMDKLVVHITKNFTTLPNIKVPLILGIWGGKGQGKSFQCELVFAKMGINAVVMSAGELESGNAGEPANLIRQRYREAADIVRKGKLCVLFINDLDAGRLGATLMNIADNPTNVQLPGQYNKEENPRVPIVVTGNDFSTLYAPLIRDGRMEKFYWAPTREDRIGVCKGIFRSDGVADEDVVKLVDTFPGQPIDFFVALRARVYDDEVRRWVAEVGVENVEKRLVNSGESPPAFEQPRMTLDKLMEYGNMLMNER
ncbi:hypothetical protein ACP4OV_002204 [Aristida adscensionis]